MVAIIGVDSLVVVDTPDSTFIATQDNAQEVKYIEYRNEKKKSDGYSLKDGKKSTTTTELFVNNGRIPKKN